MSTKLMSYVWDGCAKSGMKITKVAIMARLADFSNDEGICWPSIKTISKQIGAGESTVRGAIKELELEGWLISKQRRKGNRNDSNIYQLNVQKLKISALDVLDSDTSKSDVPDFDPSENFEKSRFDPPESGGDPSVLDPSLNNISTLQNSNESSNDENLNNFLTKHPDAYVYTKGGKHWGTQEDLIAAEYIYKKIEVLLPTIKEPNWAMWTNDIRLMRVQDGLTHREICNLFKWANKDPFWRSNILSPRKLRDQWDQLTLQSTRPKQASGDVLDWDNTDWADKLGGVI